MARASWNTVTNQSEINGASMGQQQNCSWFWYLKSRTLLIFNLQHCEYLPIIGPHGMQGIFNHAVGVINLLYWAMVGSLLRIQWLWSKVLNWPSNFPKIIWPRAAVLASTIVILWGPCTDAAGCTWWALYGAYFQTILASLLPVDSNSYLIELYASLYYLWNAKILQ